MVKRKRHTSGLTSSVNATSLHSPKADNVTLDAYIPILYYRPYGGVAHLCWDACTFKIE